MQVLKSEVEKARSWEQIVPAAYRVIEEMPKAPTPSEAAAISRMLWLDLLPRFVRKYGADPRAPQIVGRMLDGLFYNASRQDEAGEKSQVIYEAISLAARGIFSVKNTGKLDALRRATNLKLDELPNQLKELRSAKAPLPSASLT